MNIWLRVFIFTLLILFFVGMSFALRYFIVKAIKFAMANATSVVGQYGGVAGILKKDHQWGEWPLRYHISYKTQASLVFCPIISDTL